MAQAHPSQRLPEAHTCFNTMDLVSFDTADQLEEKLLEAFTSNNEDMAERPE